MADEVQGEHPPCPLHPRCRCVLLPVTVSYKELGLDMDEIKQVYRPYVIRDGNNPRVSKRINILQTGSHKGDYASWFSKQSDQVQRNVVGPNRHEMIKSGEIKFKQIVDPRTGKLFTLDQLNSKNFMVAGPADIGITGKTRKELFAITKERGLTVPPAWKELWVNVDPKGALQVRGIDAKGRRQAVYSAEHTAAAAREKFERLKDFTARFPKLVQQIEKDFDTKDEAKVLSLISKTGFRVGSDRDRKAKVKAYGASNLQADHIKIKGSKIDFAFTGKKGVSITHTLTDKKLADYLKDKQGRLFQTNDLKIRSYMKEIGFGDFKVKDFRTFMGTSTALEEIKKMPVPTNEKEYAASVNAVCKVVAAQLGNTPTVAKASYISPEVWSEWAL